MPESTYNLVVSSFYVFMTILFLIVERNDLKKVIQIISSKIQEKKKTKDIKKAKKTINILYKIIFAIIIVGIIIEICFFIQKQIVFNKYKSELKIIKQSAEIQDKQYKEILSKYKTEKRKNPYKVEGFKYKEGTLNTGYVIVDGNGNEFVWVPVLDSKRK